MSLVRSGCDLLEAEGAGRRGFRLSFEDPLLQRAGLCGILSPIRPWGAGGNGAVTTVRHPQDLETGHGHRDPFRLFTSVLLGVDPRRKLFVAFDPARHFPEAAPLRVSIGARMVRSSLDRGWHSWLRQDSEQRDVGFAEALVGFRSDQLLRYVLFERIAEGLDTGHRQRLAEEFLVPRQARRPAG